MDTLELIDETFDKDRTEVYELSIQVSLNGFSFAVKDAIRNTFVVLVSKPILKPATNHGDWDDAVNEIVASYPFLTRKFKRTLFTYTLSPYSAVPEELFHEDQVKKLFELSQPLPDNFELHYTPIANGSSFVLIFALPYTLTSAWIKIQPKTKFIAPLTPLLFSPEVTKVDKLLQVYFSGQQLCIVYHQDGVFVAANTFSYRHIDDAAYYILNFCKSLGIDSSAISIYVKGQSSNCDAIGKTLANYFTSIVSDAHYNSIHFSYRLLRHRVKYYTLFNSTAICE